MKKYFLLILACMITACTPAVKEQPSEMVLGQGVIKALNPEILLIQETTSVVSLTLDSKAGRYLCDRYDAGQNIQLLGFKTIDEAGNSHETITALVFEDGQRFNIVG